jgi:hypothetical protein
LAGVIMVMFRLNSSLSEFYLRDKKHPHLCIRVSFFSLVLVHYLNQSVAPFFSLNEFNHADVIFPALNAVHEHFHLSEGDERVSDAQKMIRDNLDEISEYYEELRERQQEIENLAITVWNNNNIN